MSSVLYFPAFLLPSIDRCIDNEAPRGYTGSCSATYDVAYAGLPRCPLVALCTRKVALPTRTAEGATQWLFCLTAPHTTAILRPVLLARVGGTPNPDLSLVSPRCTRVALLKGTMPRNDNTGSSSGSCSLYVMSHAFHPTIRVYAVNHCVLFYFLAITMASRQTSVRSLTFPLQRVTVPPLRPPPPAHQAQAILIPVQGWQQVVSAPAKRTTYAVMRNID